MAKVRKTVKEKVEKGGDGVSFVAAVNAVVTGNVGGRGASSTSASSHQRIAQRSGRTVVDSETHAESHRKTPPGEDLDPEELREEEAKELPHREGTYDRLQEEADAEAAGEDDQAPEPDSDAVGGIRKQREE